MHSMNVLQEVRDWNTQLVMGCIITCPNTSSAGIANTGLAEFTGYALCMSVESNAKGFGAACQLISDTISHKLAGLVRVWVSCSMPCCSMLCLLVTVLRSSRPHCIGMP